MAGRTGSVPDEMDEGPGRLDHVHLLALAERHELSLSKQLGPLGDAALPASRHVVKPCITPSPVRTFTTRAAVAAIHACCKAGSAVGWIGLSAVKISGCIARLVHSRDHVRTEIPIHPTTADVRSTLVVPGPSRHSSNEVCAFRLHVVVERVM
jgi:hypothetical protein